MLSKLKKEARISFLSVENNANHNSKNVADVKGRKREVGKVGAVATGMILKHADGLT